jgi:transcription elongation factor Elf1
VEFAWRMGTMSGKQMFPCPVCTGPREVLLTKKDKPYLTCDPCGVQVFIRGPAGIKEFSRLLQNTSDEPLLARLTHIEKRYRLTCPDCGHKFWITPTLIKTSMFDGTVKGFHCPERGCDGVAAWAEEAK